MSTGRVISVFTERAGTHLTAAAGIGETVLSVAYRGLSDFDEAGGQVIHETSETVLDYSTVDSDAATITLAAPLDIALAADDLIWIHPQTDDLYVEVIIDDLDDQGALLFGETLDGETESIEPAETDDEDLPDSGPPIARVPYEIRAMWDLEAIETVTVEDDGDEWIVTGVQGAQPMVQTESLPIEELPGGTDGLPPASAPADVTVTGLIEQALISHGGIPNADPVTYRYHIADTDLNPASATTVHHELPSTKTAVAMLPDGTKFVRDTTYYAAVEARDADVADVDMGPVSAWVPFDIIEQIQSTQIADGAIQTPHLSAETIIAEHLAAGSVIAAKLETILAVAGTFIAGAEEGGRVEFGFGTGDLADMLGIHAVAPDGMTVTFMVDAATGEVMVTGEAALNVMSAEQASIRQLLSLEADGETILRAGISDPQNMPSATVGWESMTPAGAALSSFHGLVWHDSHWWTTDQSDGLVKQYNSAGDFTASADLSYGGLYDPLGGLTRIGTSWYVLAQSIFGGWSVREYDANFIPVSPSNWWDWIGMPNLDGHPAIGTNGTDILISGVNEADGHRIQRYSKTGTQLADILTAEPSGFNSGIGGVLWDTTNFAAGRYLVISKRRTPGIIRAYDSLGVRQAADEWPVAATDGHCGGIAHDGSNFWHLSRSSQRLYRYEDDSNWVSAIETLEMASEFDWWDSVGTTHQSGPSPAATFLMKKRARVTLSAPNIPGGGGIDDPDGARFYLTAASGPLAADFRLNATVTGLVPGDSPTAVIADPNISTGAEPGVNNFGETTSHRIISTRVDAVGPLLELQDNYARIKPAGMDSNGIALADQLTPIAGSFNDWGATIVFTNPGIPVKVSGSLSGNFFNNDGGVNSTDCDHRVGISFDGGGTFQFGNVNTSRVGASGGVATRQETGSAYAHRSGTPTGDVVVKAQWQPGVASSDALDGFLAARMIPA